MDLTSLLNAASTSRERAAATKGESPVHTTVRNRTPWNAGGYSLPMNSANQNEALILSGGREAENSLDEKKNSTSLFLDSLNSLHKLSDSRSSISSFASSTSTSQQSHHSRFSSISTVGSFYPLSVITDIERYSNTSSTPTPDQGNEVQGSRNISLAPPAFEDNPDAGSKMAYSKDESSRDAVQTIGSSEQLQHDLQQAMRDSQKSVTPSPTDSLNALAMVAEHQLHDRQEVDAYYQQEPHYREAQQLEGQDVSLQESSAMDQVAYGDEFRGGEKLNRRLTRSASPSDAILIKRNAPMSMTSQTTPTSTTGIDLPYGLLGRLTELREGANSGLGLKNPSLQRMTHKRAFSAPDFAALGASNPHANHKSMPLGPTAELTPSPSQYRAQDDDISATVTQSGPSSPPRETVEILDKPIVCMYIPDCDTGSQPRKAISHIFGRNKMCTRLIPNFVWVHFCRKHYQRSRYRNSKEYAKLQCDLVKKQIERLHIWSQENVRKGEGAIVKDWGIAMRKREQKRLDEMSGKKDLQAFGQDAEGESDEGENPAGQGRGVPVTAVPPWLVSFCGNGYSTEKIAEIFERLHSEILNDQIPVFPDIEILPNIIVDNEEPKSPKGYTKRRPIATAHKRSVSLGMYMRPEQYHSPRRMSQPVTWNPNGIYMESSPTAQKRKRADIGFEEEFNDGSGNQHPRYRGMSMDSSRPRMTLAHRPAFSDIHEYEDPLGDQRQYQAYGQHTYPDPQMFDTYGRPTAPLPAPTPQRHQALCTAAQLDSRVSSPAQPQYSPYPQSRSRSMHQRAQSDMSMFQQQQPYDASGRSSMTAAVYYAPTVRSDPIMNGMSQMHNPQQQTTQSRDHYLSPNLYYIGSPATTNHSRHQSTPIIPRQYQSPTQQHHYPRQSGMVPLTGSYRTVEDSPQTRLLYGTRR